MRKQNKIEIGLIFIAVLAIAFCSGGKEKPAQAGGGSYEDLVGLFKEWRDFQKPKVINGVPDYSAAAMKTQHQDLRKYQQRLAAIDSTSWPVSQQIDYHLVQAEMNGLDFDHRVLRPWARNPSFYAVVTSSEPDVPAREGPEIYGVLELWKMQFPLQEKDIPAFQAKLRAIPEVLAQAKKNLTEETGDLWYLGILVKKRETTILANLAKRLAELHPSLVADVEQARASVDEFRQWLEKKQPQMRTPSGIGIDNFNWYMKNVHLVPYTWEEQLMILNREWERSVASLKLEEHRNRKLPKLEPPATEEELRARYNAAVETFMEFLRNEEIFTIPDYMRLDLFRGRLIPADGIRDFFTQIEYSDSLPMKCHSFHWLEKQRMVRDPHPSPIRSGPLLYNIWDSRSEGLATAWEELMMNAGLLDRQPRARELIYMLVAMRCARAMGDLKMHSGEFTLQEAVKYAVERTPYGWLRADGDTVWTDMRIYLHQPGYGTSYVVGKDHIDKLIADRALQMGKGFTLKKFMDEFFASGIIPVSMIRWEMTGLEDEIKKLW
jgi:hypothetical protein